MRVGFRGGLRLAWNLARLPVRLHRQAVAAAGRHAELVAALRGQTEALAAELRATRAELAALGGRLDRHVDSLAGRLDWQAGGLVGLTQRVEAIGGQVAAVDGRLAAAQDRLLRASAEVAERVYLAEQAARDPGRAAAEAALRAALPPATPTDADGLSILVACWNHAPLLPRAVASALATLDALPVPGEVVVLDDGSRDDGAAVARRLAASDGRVRVLRSPANLGLERVRNVMLDQARFRHALTLDADNTLIPAGVAVLYRAAVDTGATLAYGPVLMCYPDGSPFWIVNHDRVGPDLFAGNYIDTLALFRVAAVRQAGGYYTGVHTCEDWERNLHLLRRGELAVLVPVLTGRYRSSSQSLVNDAGQAVRIRTLNRVHAPDGPPPADALPAAVYHPAAGYVWATPASGRAADPLPDVRSRRVLVVGSGGVRNLGDDAILLGALERLRRVRPDWVAAVVTDGPHVPPLGRLAHRIGTTGELVASLPPDLAAADPAFAPWVRGDRSIFPADELTRYDLVLFAGGGFWTSYWPALPAWRAALAAACRAVGVPYVATGQGLGRPDPVSARLLRPFVLRAVGFGVRDPLSLDWLARRGLAGPRTAMTGDDALGLAAGAGDPAPRLGFHARRGDYVGLAATDLERWAAAADEAAAGAGWAVRGLTINDQPQAPEADLLRELAAAAPRRADWQVPDHVPCPRAAVSAAAGCAAVVTSSYHLALFALDARRPVAFLAATEYYRDKARGLERLAGRPVVWDGPPPTADELRDWFAAGPPPALPGPQLADAWLTDVLDRVGDTSMRRAA